MEPKHLQRMALLAPNSWDEETRSARIVVSTDADVGDGFQLLHTNEAIRWPVRPIPADYDHMRSSKAIWGAVTELSLERSSDGMTQLVGRVVVDGPEDAMAIALPRFRTGSARFSVDARIYAWRDGVDLPLVATDWEPQLVSLVAAGQDTHAVMRADQSTQGDPPMTDDVKAGGDPVTEEQQQVEAPVPAPAAEPAEQEAQRSTTDDRHELAVRRAAAQAQLPEDVIQKVIAETQGKDADRKSTRLNSSHVSESRMPSSA